MDDLKIFEKINAELEKLEIDQIKQRLQPIIKGMMIGSPIFDPGTYLYRARKIDSTFNKDIGIKYADLIYPPRQLSKLGRLNRQGAPIFYCSMSKEVIFFELEDLHPGDELVLTFWQTTERMLVNNIGYTQHVFERLGAKRECPQWHPPGTEFNCNKETVSLRGISPRELDAVLSRDKNSELRRALSECFMCAVGPTETYKYRLTTAIGELHLAPIKNQDRQFAGVIYPSVRMWGNADNLALLPWFVDQHIKFKKASHVRIDSREDTKFSITTLDSANKFHENGKLAWLGRNPNWSLTQPGQGAKFTFTPGRDDDGDYQASLDGTPCHWVAIDMVTGQILQSH